MPSTLVASSHRHELVRGVGLPLIGLPPYSPELNPAERVFEEVRRWIEEKVYPSLEDKVAAVEAYLTELESNPDRVRGLAGLGLDPRTLSRDSPRVMRRDQDDLARFYLLLIMYYQE